MNIFTSKRKCSHRFVDQYSGRCIHCGQMNSSSMKSSVQENGNLCHSNGNYEIDDGPLELEHYERLVLMLDEWKKKTINRIELIHKSKCERLRDQYEHRKAQQRRSRTENCKTEITETNKEVQLTNINFRLVHSTCVDTEYALMAASSDTILLHDGRIFKLFDKKLQPLVALDLSISMRERTKVVDLCYISNLSSYLILYEQGLWVFQPGSNANLITSIKNRGYLSLTTNNKDLFMLDIDGTIEQRSLVSWTFLRRYKKQHLLNDYINDQLLSIRFHTIEYTMLVSIVRTASNRRCLMIYKHFGSNTFQLLDRILFPNINIYGASPLSISHMWLLTTCEKQSFFFIDNKREYNQREQQQIWFSIDCDYKIKNVIEFTADERCLVLRTVKPSQIKLYRF